MGIFRLILAYLVVIGHMHPSENFSIGVFAVISFFLLSGFFMTALIGKYYSHMNSVRSFYAERFFRLAPQFYFYFILTLLFSYMGFRHEFMKDIPSPGSIALQLMGIPLNFYRHFPNMLIPQAWSLGLEIIFYLIFPFIFLLNLRLVAFACSLVIYTFAYYGFIDNELWGYRYLPGVLFIFLCGSFLFKSNSLYENFAILITWLSAFVFLMIIFIYPNLNNLYNKSVLLGIVFSVPFLYLLKPISDEKKIKNNFDTLAGNLSYGVFLCHMLVIGVTNHFIHPSSISEIFLATLSVLIISTILSFISFSLAEKPLISFRRNYRKSQLVN